MEELHPRVAHLEKELHTVRYRMDALDSEKLPHRVTALESAVKEIVGSVHRTEMAVEKIEKDVAKQKIWMAVIMGAGMGGAELISFLQSIVS
jgi:hypothetical protein